MRIYLLVRCLTIELDKETYNFATMKSGLGKFHRFDEVFSQATIIIAGILTHIT